MKLQASYYLNDNVVSLAQNLIGKLLLTRIDGHLTSGLITETEAYAGVADRASHAFGGKRTARNEVMYHCGGKAYVYLCYGLHHLFNIVTNEEDIPHAVLIRSILPYDGLQIQLERRKCKIWLYPVMQGPGKVSQALGITVQENGQSLLGRRIWLEDMGILLPKNAIYSSARIGVDYAGDDALLPYRFYTTEANLKACFPIKSF
ncbi:MAG: DNA-3-methyladenine glycosylase [Flavobacteriales bacterium]|nr:DNA-3-methyladenine glycosylase [Flavobacteriales bacterium]